LTFVDPVSPYGFGATRLDGTPHFADYAGSGGGTGNPEFIKRLADHDTSSESPFSPRNVMNSSYWAASHREPKEREDMLREEVFPPQPMVTQIRNVLEEYKAKGGRVRMEMFEGSGHGPLFDAAERWNRLFHEFLASVEVPANV